MLCHDLNSSLNAEVLGAIKIQSRYRGHLIRKILIRQNDENLNKKTTPVNTPKVNRTPMVKLLNEPNIKGSAKKIMVNVAKGEKIRCQKMKSSLAPDNPVSY